MVQPRLTTFRFAQYRAYFEGLDERVLHAHYGLLGTDVRVTRRTLATLRDTLTIAAPRGACATSMLHTCCA